VTLSSVLCIKIFFVLLQLKLTIMKIEISMTELLLIVDMIKNGVEPKTEPSDEDLTLHFVTEDDEPEEIVLKRKHKKKK